MGSWVGWWVDHAAERAPKPDGTKRLGVLLASGLIVGESGLAVIFTALVAFTNNQFPVGVVGDSFATASEWLGGIAFGVIIYALYRWAGRLLPAS